MEKIKPTYEYYQGNCPVQMKEFFSGKLIAIYDAYIDKGGYTWKLYPKKKVSAQPLCPFRYKEITIFMAKTLERPEEPITPAPAPKSAKIENDPTPRAVQIPLIKKNYT